MLLFIFWPFNYLLRIKYIVLHVLSLPFLFVVTLYFYSFCRKFVIPFWKLVEIPLLYSSPLRSTPLYSYPPYSYLLYSNLLYYQHITILPKTFPRNRSFRNSGGCVPHPTPAGTHTAVNGIPITVDFISWLKL